MINAKKLLTKAAATVTCVAMLAGNTLSAFAGNVTIDPKDATHVFDEGYDFYMIGEEPNTISWDDELVAIFADKNYAAKLGVDKDSKIIIGNRVYTIDEYEYDKETGDSAFFFAYAGKYEDFFDNSELDDYTTRLGKKIKEIYAADKNKSLKYNNHVEYNEGDGIRYDMMEALSKTKNVVLDFYFTYNEKHYHAKLTSAKAKVVYDAKIEVYGPAFILKNFDCEELKYETK